MASMALYRLDVDDGPFGYDFSAGYTSLEKDDDAPPKPKKIGLVHPLAAGARGPKTAARSSKQRTRDEERMDQLLEKIARSGKESLTDDEAPLPGAHQRPPSGTCRSDQVPGSTFRVRNGGAWSLELGTEIVCPR